MPTQIQFRRGTAAQWTAANPLLGSGELGYETDTGKIKVGDGATLWNSLSYQTIAQSQVTNLTSDLAAKAPLASPALTGTPTAPTVAVGTNTTQIATTAFVNAEIANDAVLNSLVSAKGSLVAASAASTPVNLAVGSNGQMLMADSSATAGLRYVDPPANRRLTINGDMQVHQRGTSVTGITTNGYYTADRWQTQCVTAGTWTQTVETDAPTGSGLRKSLKMLCTTAASTPVAEANLNFRQRLEGQDLQRVRKGTSDAQQLTVSFWVKANVTGTYVLELFDLDNTRHVAATYSVSASATWERKVITFPADTAGVLDNDADASLMAVWWLAGGSDFTSGTLPSTWASNTNANRAVGQTNLAAATNNYWQITGVQLETGPVATPFEFEPFEATLRKCQRYYYRQTPGATGAAFGIGQAASTTAAYAFIPFPVTMRVRPTALEQSGTASDYKLLRADTQEQTLSAVPTFNNASANGATVTSTVAANLVAGNATGMITANATAYLAWSAEL